MKANNKINSTQPSGLDKYLPGRNIWIVTLLCVVTFVCYNYTLSNQFTNWDDDVYITNDQYIKAFTANNLKTIFTEDITKNNYHPLTMLSLAVNYHYAQLEPRTYYLTNIFIHIVNVILVFFLAARLCKRLKLSKQRTFYMTFLSALWFAIHPMHVESVSWIAERKDVLYAFFYFSGLLLYLRYIEGGKIKWYFLTLLCFIASCLSKPMAVVFPVSLLTIDLLLSRKWEWKILVEKIPIFIASLVCGGYAYYRQNATGAIAPFGALTLAERTMYASYGFVMYISKLFNPTFLSTFYPYPYRYIDGSLPWIYYASPIIAILIITVPLFVSWKLYKSQKDATGKYFRVIAFGLGFFIANIIFVLQFISCGAAIMADRYSYVSYFGLMFLIVYFLGELMERFPPYKITFIAFFILVSVELYNLCRQRTYVWHNSETLLKDAIHKYKFGALLSYKWLGNYYLDSLQLDSAEGCYRMLTMLHAADAKVYDNLGNVLKFKNQFIEAMGAYDTSLQKGGNIYRTLLDRSSCFSDLGDTNNAIRDYVTAVKLNPDAEKNYSEAGFSEVQSKLYNNAIGRYNILLKFNPDNPYYYFYRGVSKFGEDKIKESVSDFKSALLFNNREVSVVAAYNLSVACDSLLDDSDAVKYALLAQQYGYNLDPEYIHKLKIRKQPK